jgi:hypothetical protein
MEPCSQEPHPSVVSVTQMFVLAQKRAACAQSVAAEQSFSVVAGRCAACTTLLDRPHSKERTELGGRQ